MTNIEYQLSILQAARDGKEIERRKLYHEDWGDIADPKGYSFNFIDFIYRIKATPTYKPYSKVDESWIGKVVRSKESNSICLITAISISEVYVFGFWNRLPQMFEFYTWQDGTPFGELQ